MMVAPITAGQRICGGSFGPATRPGGRIYLNEIGPPRQGRQGGEYQETPRHE